LSDDRVKLTRKVVKSLMACKQTRKTNWLARQGDAAGRILAYVYFEDEPTRRNFSKRLSKDDARRMAQQILRCPSSSELQRGLIPAKRRGAESQTLASDHRTFPSRHSSAVLGFCGRLGERTCEYYS